MLIGEEIQTYELHFFTYSWTFELEAEGLRNLIEAEILRADQNL